ncbi:MAG: C-type lectin domain-containing protein [Myxococcota bacterium]|nr:C-type lectin domain-containing protein [Myxococcota bacterium]
MRLVRVDDGAENDWITGIAAREGWASLWTGAADTPSEGSWRWPDGAQFWMGDETGVAVGGLYERWATGEPDDTGDYGVLGVADREWSDSSGGTLPYVCEAY